MRTKFLWSLLTLIVVGIMSIELVSCSGSDGDGSSGSDALVKKLMSSKWTYSGADVNGYSYGWSYETETYTLYFLDEKTGVEYWSYKDKDTDMGTSKNSGLNYFTYYVTGNKIVIRYEKGGGITLEDHGSYIGEGNDIIDWYASQSLTYSDKSQMTEWLDSRGYKDAVNKYVHGVFTEKGDIELSLEITSTLDSYYPNKKIKYLVVVSEYSHGSWNEKETYSFNDKNNLYVDNLYFYGDVNFGIYFKIYQALQEKIAQGEALTDDEKELLKEVKPIVTEIASNLDFDIYVEINGNRYDVPCDYKKI